MNYELSDEAQMLLKEASLDPQGTIIAATLQIITMTGQWGGMDSQQNS